MIIVICLYLFTILSILGADIFEGKSSQVYQILYGTTYGYNTISYQNFDMINIFENMPLYIRELAVFSCLGGNDKMAILRSCNSFLGQKIVKSILYDLRLKS